MKKITLLLLMLLVGIGSSWASTYTPGTRATSLAAGKYFIYNTCWVYTNYDYTGFIASNGSTITYNHGPKPSSYTATDANAYWTLAVVDADTYKYTLRNSEGYYVNESGELSTTEAYIYIEPYACSGTGCCGEDVYVEPTNEGTATLPSTTASENSGIFRVGNSDGSTNWTSKQGTSFNTHSAGQPMAFYPVTETAGTRTKYKVTAISELTNPSTLTVGSYVAFYNYCKKYVYEGTGSDANKLTLNSTAPATQTEYSYSLPQYAFKVGGSEGAYTFQTTTGNYVQALAQSTTGTTGTSAETFSLAVSDDYVGIKGSNGQYFNKSAWSTYVVGWWQDAAADDNSKYKIAVLTIEEAEESYVNVTYNYQWNGVTQYSTVVPTTKDAAYTYSDPTTFYGATTTATAPTAETAISEDKVVNYNYTADTGVTLPFETTTITGTTFPTDAKWYMLAMRSATKYGKYNGTNVANSTNNSTATVNTAFCFTGNPVAGYQIHNFNAGAGKALKAPSSKGSCTFDETGTTLDYVVSATNSYKEFKIRNSTNGYIHDLDDIMGGWYSDSAPEDAGSNITFTEIDDVIYTAAITGATDGKVTYNSTEYADGETITIATGTAVGLTSSSFGAATVSGTVNDVTLSGETVTAAYQTALFKEGTPYLLKVKDQAYYIDAVNNNTVKPSDNTVCVRATGTPLYFKYNGNNTWKINVYGDYASGKYINVSTWNMTRNQTDGAAWTFESAGDDAGYYMSQSVYNKGGDCYVGLNASRSYTDGEPFYDDKAKSGATAFEIVETTPFVATTISDGAFASDTKWYRMKVRSKYATSDYVDGYEALGKMNQQTTSAFYCFVGDSENGYKIYNYIQGANKALYNNGNDESLCTYTESGSTWVYKHNTAKGFQFQLDGQTDTYINDVSQNSKMGVWKNTSASTDDGSVIYFEEIPTADLATAEALPQPGKYYTFQETTTSQYFTPLLSEVEGKTSRLAMEAEGSVENFNNVFYFTGAHLKGYVNNLYPSNGDFLGQAAEGNTGAFFYFKKVSDGVYTVCYNNGRALYGAYTGYVDGAGDDNTGDGYKFTVTAVTPTITETRTTAANAYGTICLPYDATVEGAVVMEFDGRIEEGLVFTPVYGNAIEAGVPYLYRATANEQTFTTTGTTYTEATAVKNFTGSYTEVDLSKTTENTEENYFLYTQDNKFHPAGTYVHMGAYRCYFPTLPSVSGARVSSNSVVFGIYGDATTGISTLNTSVDLNKDGKFIQNGRMVIVNNGKKFNAAGQTIK